DRGLNTGGYGMFLSNNGPNTKEKEGVELVFDLGTQQRVVGLCLKIVPDSNPEQTSSGVCRFDLYGAPNCDGPWTAWAGDLRAPEAPGWNSMGVNGLHARFIRVVIRSSQRRSTHVRLFGLNFLCER
ncbi:hypothetical protein CYMTET_50344, partial [Cymbomonas tetramitiformis]